MNHDPVCPDPSWTSSFPDLLSWQQLAEEVAPVLGGKMQAFIEEDQRYIMRSQDIYQSPNYCPNPGNNPAAFELRPALYLRLRFWEKADETAEIRWVKVDYLVLALPLRRQGLGSQVVNLVKAWIAKQNNYNFIALYTRPEAALFWEKCGFASNDEAYQGKMLYPLV